jgi:hypothetical protein
MTESDNSGVDSPAPSTMKIYVELTVEFRALPPTFTQEDVADLTINRIQSGIRSHIDSVAQGRTWVLRTASYRNDAPPPPPERRIETVRKNNASR